MVDLFTFGSDYADIFYLKGTPIGQRGISGGPVIDNTGTAIGLISTKGNSEEHDEGSLYAITLSYIHRTILEETGFSFDENLQGDLAFRSKIFKETLVPFLSAMLGENLE